MPLALLAAAAALPRTIPAHGRLARGAVMCAPQQTTEQLKLALVEKAKAFRDAQDELWAAPEVMQAEGGASQVDERLSAPLKNKAFANVEIGYDAKLGKLRNETIALLEELATHNPTSAPLEGWRTDDCTLDGTWRLLFTTGADATFRKGEDDAARPVTFQQIDAKKGYFVNSVDFPLSKAKLKGFRVVVKGVKLSDTEMSLKFRRVKLLRRSKWLKTVIIPLPPSRLLRAVARWSSRGKAKLSRRGAGFQMLYLDDELRAHKTFDGQYFLQQRCRYKYK